MQSMRRPTTSQDLFVEVNMCMQKSQDYSLKSLSVSQLLGVLI